MQACASTLVRGPPNVPSTGRSRSCQNSFASESSVERIGIHVEGVVCQARRLGGFPEVGRRRGPRHRRRRKVYWTRSPQEKTVRCGTAQRAQDYAKAAIARRRSHRYEPLVGAIALRRRPAERGTDLKRALATILIVDIVGSTAKAAKLGDARWTKVMGHYYAAVRKELKSSRGKEVVTTGDGVLATFKAPAAGMNARPRSRRRCARWG